MPEQPDGIEWTGSNFQDVCDFCRRHSTDLSAVAYRDGDTLYMDTEEGPTHVHPGDRITRTGPDTFIVIRAV